jgi:hypothetical protein
MTLIATALTDDYVVQVVDRRITRGGHLYDDFANKAVCVVCADAVFTIAYTGLVFSPYRTDEWLVNWLSASGHLTKSLPNLVRELEAEVGREMQRFQRLPDEQRRLTFVLAGFSHMGPFVVSTTNCEDHEGRSLPGTSTTFDSSYCLRNANRMMRLDVILTGTEAAVDSALFRTIQKIRKGYFRKTGKEIAQALVAIVRRASKHPSAGHLISPHCVSSVHQAEGGVLVEDHFFGERAKQHLPHLVTPSVSFKHIHVRSGP